jgi:DNA repair protein RadA/Sms
MVSQPELRLREAGKLGFRRVLMPRRRDTAKSERGGVPGIEILEIGHLQDLLDWLYNEVRSLSAGKRVLSQ